MYTDWSPQERTTFFDIPSPSFLFSQSQHEQPQRVLANTPATPFHSLFLCLCFALWSWQKRQAIDIASYDGRQPFYPNRCRRLLYVFKSPSCPPDSGLSWCLFRSFETGVSGSKSWTSLNFRFSVPWYCSLLPNEPDVRKHLRRVGGYQVYIWLQSRTTYVCLFIGQSSPLIIIKL